jgi:hypothetical protein
VRVGSERWTAERQRERYARALAVLKDVRARHVSVEAALDVMALLERRAYQRGFNTGKRRRVA